MDELISKRAVIEAIEKARANVGHNLERSIGKSIIEILDDVGRDINGLPSALGTNLAEVGTDCISRQAAIDALEKDMASIDQIIKGMSAMDVRLDAYVSQRNQVVYDIDTIKQLPPIQPEPHLIPCSERLPKIEEGHTSKPCLVYCKISEEEN